MSTPAGKREHAEEEEKERERNVTVKAGKVQGGERNMLNTGYSMRQNQDSTGQNSNIHLLRTSFVIAKWHSGSQLACILLIVTSKKYILSILEAQLNEAKDCSSPPPSFLFLLLPACVSLANLCALIAYTASTNVDAFNSW